MKPTPLALFSLIGISTFCSNVQALDIKLGHVLAPTHNWHIAAEGFADDVREATDSRINFQVFPSGQLGNETRLIEGMQIGSMDAGVIGCGSFQSLEPKFGIVELPYSWENREAAYAAYDGELGSILEELAENKSIKVLSWWENGFRHVTNNRGPIESPHDLEGLKIRVTPDRMRLNTFEALGANPAPLSFGELYSALQQGVFDAQENPLSIIHSSSFYEVQDYISLTGHVWAPACLAIAGPTWNKINADDQAVIQALADEWRDKQRAMAQEDDKNMLEMLAAEGMQINEVDTASFNERVQGVWNDYSDVFGEELMETVRQYQTAE